jgi:hypothetical protein
MPAQAGIQSVERLFLSSCWIPASAGMTNPCHLWQNPTPERWGREVSMRFCCLSPACLRCLAFSLSLLIPLGCVSSGEQPGCFLDLNGLHQEAFLPIG